MPEVVILRESCKGVEGCGICIFVCPKKLFASSGEMNQAGYIPPVIKDMDQCTGCQTCMFSCPDFALVAERAETAAAGEDDE